MSDSQQEPGSTTPQAGETQNVDTQAPAGAATGEGDKGNAPAAAAVDYTFTMPEGVEVDSGRLDAFKALAQEAKLPADVAQKVVSMEAERVQKEAEAHVAMVQGWADALTADPVLGVPENQAIAKGVIDKFGTPELRQYLSGSGLGNHPELVKLAYSIGKAMSQDGFVNGGAPAAEVSTAKKLFPTMN